VKFSFFSALFFLIPLCVLGQDQKVSNTLDSPVIINSTAAPENYHLITPVLLRESSILSEQEESAISSGSKFQSL